jgi:uncharacterized protein
VTWLLDGNLLVALRLDTHVHHERAHRWFAGLGNDRFATCAITQGTLLRVHMRFATDGTAQAAWQALSDFIQHPKHEFWEAGFSYELVPSQPITVEEHLAALTQTGFSVVEGFWYSQMQAGFYAIR